MAGRLLWFADAISRDKIIELNSVCHTLHIRHNNIGLNEQVRDFIGGLEVEMLFASADLGISLPSPANTGQGKVVRFSEAARTRRRKRKATKQVEGIEGIVSTPQAVAHIRQGERETISSARPSHSEYGGEADEVISYFGRRNGGVTASLQPGTATSRPC